MKQGDGVTGAQGQQKQQDQQTEREPTKEELEAEFDPNDEGKTPPRPKCLETAPGAGLAFDNWVKDEVDASQVLPGAKLVRKPGTVIPLAQTVSIAPQRPTVMVVFPRTRCGPSSPPNFLPLFTQGHCVSKRVHVVPSLWMYHFYPPHNEGCWME
ncbi:hypothetical protein ZHAS_00003657 [Anopheles sinensis]|uniref:Uncharacterized protein n=1 Tax=Anopheles sinensis TaxID=74873 RepID=A0A084VEW3_ANOSI|nr:hypothetical protein ZHAS_00003657 [Anopheles sinensis]